jgi:S-adenosylmethionine hydrolase
MGDDMILFFTDFSLNGPYMGQMHSLVAQRLPELSTIDLVVDAPTQNPRASAYLLASCVAQIPPESIIVAVVDPGVGGPRKAIMQRVDKRWYVGPDNGLLDVVYLQGQQVERWQVNWRPASLSASFHGRDLFTPLAIELAQGNRPDSIPYPLTESLLAKDCLEIVYIDSFGNLFTGIRGSEIKLNQQLSCQGRIIHPAGTFSDVQPGQLFWYVNSNGLVEIAANQTRAVEILSARIGTEITLR